MQPEPKSFDMSKRHIHFLWVKSEFGAGTWGAALGPDAIQFAALNRGLTLFSQHPNTVIDETENTLRIDPNPDPETGRAHHLNNILPVIEQVCRATTSILRAGSFPFIISGDHSNAAGTIAGLRAAYPDERLGVIWIDAHADVHSPYTSPSGNVHGMPLAASLGLRALEAIEGHTPPAETGLAEVSERVAALWEQLCHVGGVYPKLHNEDLVFIGIRDYEPAEQYIIESRGIRHYVPQQINRLGLERIVAETYEYLKHCDRLYVSFDIDSLDKQLVPGTGTPVGHGLTPDQAQYLLAQFWAAPHLAAIEFTEINPLLDVGNQTAEIALECIETLLVTPYA